LQLNNPSEFLTIETVKDARFIRSIEKLRMSGAESQLLGALERLLK
jgi:hypothetical protein